MKIHTSTSKLCLSAVLEWLCLEFSSRPHYWTTGQPDACYSDLWPCSHDFPDNVWLSCDILAGSVSIFKKIKFLLDLTLHFVSSYVLLHRQRSKVRSGDVRIAKSSLLSIPSCGSSSGRTDTFSTRSRFKNCSPVTWFKPMAQASKTGKTCKLNEIFQTFGSTFSSF